MSNIIELPLAKDITLKEALDRLREANEELATLEDKMDVVILLGIPKDVDKAYIFQQILGKASMDPLVIGGLLSYIQSVHNTILLTGKIASE